MKGPEHCITVLQGARGRSNASPATSLAMAWIFGSSRATGDSTPAEVPRPSLTPMATRPTPTPDDDLAYDQGAGAALIFSSRPSAAFKGHRAVHVSTALRSHQSFVFVAWKCAEVAVTARRPPRPGTRSVDAARGAATAAAAPAAKEAAPAAAAAHWTPRADGPTAARA